MNGWPAINAIRFLGRGIWQQKQPRTKKEAQGNAKKENLQNIDYKMISFTLAGKDYGINILRVKEIRKAGNFTFVPNTPAFVLGSITFGGISFPSLISG
jgi:chemotaxis signal transduction protein